jgi:SAM-dependent methyltransferase
MSLSDPAYVKEQYCGSKNLDARIALHARFSTAPHDFHRWVFDHFNLHPQARVLELGCGNGALWGKNRDRIPTTWNLILSDNSVGMLSSTRCVRVPAYLLQLDAQAIPFSDETYDAMVADHMLYCVPDLPRAIAEICRVLRPDGKLYAATNGTEHMREYFQLVSASLRTEVSRPTYNFSLESGEEQLRRHFVYVERFDFDNALAVAETEPLVGYAMSTSIGKQIKQHECEFRRMLAERIAREGAFRITKVAGMLVASKGNS